MNLYPKRLIEVDLPIKRVSAHARREKSSRHGAQPTRRRRKSQPVTQQLGLFGVGAS